MNVKYMASERGKEESDIQTGIKTDRNLLRLNISPKLVIWIINFLSHRKQFVRFKGVLSGERSISTGVPQGCVLSPVLFTLYTNDCTGTENTIFIKYSDDTAIVDL